RHRRAAMRAESDDGEPEHVSKRAASAAESAKGFPPHQPCASVINAIDVCGNRGGKRYSLITFSIRFVTFRIKNGSGDLPTYSCRWYKKFARML
ncbi:MAG: hypothetical protein ACRDNO_34335, partial [Trebonia sp.]